MQADGIYWSSFYAGEPVTKPQLQVLVSVNERIPGTAMYLNTTKSEDPMVMDGSF